MNAALFTLSFLLAAPFWALLIVAPTWSVTRRIIASPYVAVPPLLVYAVLVLPDLGGFLGAVAAPTLTGVAALLATPAGAAAGWAHFIGFDLFVGRWIHLDARERGIHPLATSPVLVVTILLGPLGLLLYFLLRAVVPVSREPAVSTTPPPAAASS